MCPILGGTGDTTALDFCCLVVMLKLVLITAILALLLQSIAGFLPLAHVPHEHILIGNVTPEQLRAHEEAEAQEDTGFVNPPMPTAPLSDVARTATGGLIISFLPFNSGLLSVLHFEMALHAVLVFLIPFFCFTLPVYRVAWQTPALAAPDPPPRSISAFG